MRKTLIATDKKLELTNGEESQEPGMAFQACCLPMQVATLEELCILGQHELHSEFKSSQELLSFRQIKANQDLFIFA